MSITFWNFSACSELPLQANYIRASERFTDGTAPVFCGVIRILQRTAYVRAYSKGF
jgi:hypothetical protein